MSFVLVSFACHNLSTVLCLDANLKNVDGNILNGLKKKQSLGGSQLKGSGNSCFVLMCFLWFSTIVLLNVRT